MHKEPIRIPGFAPSDPTDGREKLDWRSKYAEPEARLNINCEAAYLGTLLALVPVGLLMLWLEGPKYWFGIPEAKYPTIAKYGMAWISGMLGGTLFGLKWLYHVVAHGLWNLDRRLWRLFTPHISGGLAFAVIALISSGIVRVFDRAAVESGPLVVGGSFLVGYFSDSAIAKLSEVAETLFGSSRAKTKRTPTKGTIRRRELPSKESAD